MMNNPFMAALGGGQMPMGNFSQMVRHLHHYARRSHRYDGRRWL